MVARGINPVHELGNGVFGVTFAGSLCHATEIMPKKRHVVETASPQ